MKNTLLYCVLAALLILTAINAMVSTLANNYHKEFIGGESICRTNDSNQSYCRYKGMIEGLYVNQSGLMLVYLKSPFDGEETARFGYPIRNGEAVATLTTGTPASEEMLTQLRLAYEKRIPVEMHMRDVHGGFLLLDRVWLR